VPRSTEGKRCLFIVGLLRGAFFLFASAKRLFSHQPTTEFGTITCPNDYYARRKPFHCAFPNQSISDSLLYMMLKCTLCPTTIEWLERLTIQSKSTKTCFCQTSHRRSDFLHDVRRNQDIFIMTTRFGRSLCCLACGLLTVYGTSTYPPLQMSTTSHRLLQLSKDTRQM